MHCPTDFQELACAECANGQPLGFDFTMAFQPIIDLNKEKVFAYEALVRGINGEPAGEIFKQVNEDNLYRFDQTCRVKAVKLAADLQIDCPVSINFMPRSVYKPELCLRTTIAAAKTYGLPLNQIIFESTEGEKVDDPEHLKNIFDYYKQQGFKVAIDDFGAGYSGLNQLVDFQPDIIKLDMHLTRDIHLDSKRQIIVKYVVQICRDLGIEVIAEGVESFEEFNTIRDLGIAIMQGYYFARPKLEQAESVDLQKLLA